MLKEIILPLGTRFEYDESKQELALNSLFGMACAYHDYDEMDYSRRGLFLVCLDSKRYEANLLRYVFKQSDNTFIFTARDEEGSFAIESTWRFLPDYGIIRCGTTLTNTSNRSRILRRAYPRWSFCPGKYSVYSQLSRWSSENQGSFQPLKGADLYLHGRPARSCIGATPYCVLRDEETSAACAFHVLPRGNWAIHVHSDLVSDEAPVPVIEAGLSDTDLFMALEPGQTIALPDVLLQQIPDGKLENAPAPLHKFIAKELLPDCGIHQPPILYNGWLYRFTDFTHEQMLQQLDAAKAAGCEVFIIDAGWFGGDEGWEQVGNWSEKPGAPFYGNMRQFADEVRAKGLKFGFWMEPERWIPGIPIRKEHPEWFPHNTIRIDLTIPEAARYFHDVMADNIRKFDAEYIKLDFNASDGYDESGQELYGYCRVLTDIMGQLRREFPTLFIENCASGSLRNDLSSSQLYDHHFVSDNAHPYETLRIRQGGMLRIHPMRYLNWLVLRPAPERYTPIDKLPQIMACSAATWDELGLYPLHYVMLSGFLGFPGFSGDLASLPAEQLQLIRGYVDFYKENRGWLADAAVHPLTSFGNFMDYDEYLAFQIAALDESRSLLLVFTNGMSRRNYRRFRLKELDANKTYTVTLLFGAPSSFQPDTFSATGQELMDYGAPVNFQTNMHLRHDAALFLIQG